MNLRLNFLALLLCVPVDVYAEAYKCKQPNGTISFQEQPCPVGTAGSTIALKPIPGGNADPSAAPAKKAKKFDPSETLQNKELASKQRRAEEERDAQNQNILAENKAVRCNSARQQLGVLKEARPVFRRDDKGERQYMNDENRPAAIAAAEKRVAETCK